MDMVIDGQPDLDGPVKNPPRGVQPHQDQLPVPVETSLPILWPCESTRRLQPVSIINKDGRRHKRGRSRDLIPSDASIKAALQPVKLFEGVGK